MRIWSLHPKYLDAKGLVALWRETLLAKHVLEGKTKGYKHHPQLVRFRDSADPLSAINQYLASIYEEACERGYNFNKEKIDWGFIPGEIKVNTGQAIYEKEHLLRKLAIRDEQKHQQLIKCKKIDLHPLFKETEGGVEDWETV